MENDTVMMEPVAKVDGVMNGAVMLTGNQIAAARRLAGYRTQAELAAAAEVSRPTVERAERFGDEIPGMNTEIMVRIVRALERAGIEFYLDGGTLAGGVGLRLRGALRAGRP